MIENSMKKLSRLLFIMLILLIILGMAISNMFYANAVTYTGTCGDNLTWKYDSSTFVLTISGTGEMYNQVMSDGESGYLMPWCKYASKIQQIIIQDGVTSIGDWAFFEFSSLKKITIAESVTSIGLQAFGYCTSIEDITIPDSVRNIGIQAFGLCTNLTNITLGKGITEISEYMFYGCSSLVDIDLNNNVISIGEFAFSECTNLTSVIINENLAEINASAFENCENIENIYYFGSISQWEKMLISDNNEVIDKAKIHFHYGNDHTLSGWSVVVTAILGKSGEQQRICTECDYVESREYVVDYLADINIDGLINETDYHILVNCVCLQNNLDEKERLIADANQDGAVDGFDAVCVDLYIS
ncbi:MAG: hypothetical protein E7528_08060 [Ruminococcaceae bacterium]|nr:hypothetical protein [Oscillospiraceae bacterium]